MRTFIITLSILMLAFSAFIFVKALKLSAQKSVVQGNREEINATELPPKAEKPVEGLKEQQAAGRTLFEKLPTEPANPEDTPLVQDNREEKLRETAKGRVLAIFDGEAFQSSQVVVDEGLTKAVQKVVRDIVASPNYSVIVEGHTDNVPVIYPARFYSDNMGLSILRAKGVADILVQNGVARENISVIGYGETRPIDTNDTTSGRAKNRRVEVKIIPNN